MPATRLSPVTVAAGDIEVEVLPAIGARVHRLRVFGHDLLRTPSDPAVHLSQPFLWGAYVMAPWCNRIAALPTQAGGEVIDVLPDLGEATALHGQVHTSPWSVAADGSFVSRGGGDRWPWPYETTLGLTIEGATLRIRQTLTNLGEGRMPAGLGIHPWFTGPLEVRIGSSTVLPSNVDPGARFEPVHGSLDLREGRPMAIGLDASWPDPEGGDVGFRWPTSGISATLHAASNAGLCIVAASPRADGVVAVEPQTHAPYGLRRLLAGEPHGMHWLEPGTALRLETALTFWRED